MNVSHSFEHRRRLGRWPTGPSRWVGLSLLVALLPGCGKEPAVRQLRITMDTVAVLDFTGLPTPAVNAPVAASSNRYAVVPRPREGEIFVFDSSGGQLRRFGREGRGPGEHRRITELTFGHHDSLFVFDTGNRRVQVYGPRYDFVRDFRLDAQVFGAAWADASHLVVQGRFEDGRAPGARGRLVSRDGTAEPVAFEPGVHVLGTVEGNIRPLTPAARGGVWMSSFRRPSLRLLDASGRDVQTTARVAEWMNVVPENADDWEQLLDTRAAVLGITEDGEERLWVLMGVPPDRLPPVAGTDPRGTLARLNLQPQDLADHVLAVLDPADSTGWLVVERRDYFNGGLLSSGRAYVMNEDALGERRISILRLELTEPEAGGE